MKKEVPVLLPGLFVVWACFSGLAKVRYNSHLLCKKSNSGVNSHSLRKAEALL